MSQNENEPTTNETKQERRIPCEVYSRIVGYLRPVQNWNVAKRREWQDRRTYRVPTVAELGDDPER